MSVPARYEKRVFRPLEEVKGRHGEVYRCSRRGTARPERQAGMVESTERSFDLDNEEDAVYDDDRPPVVVSPDTFNARATKMSMIRIRLRGQLPVERERFHLCIRPF